MDLAKREVRRKKNAVRLLFADGPTTKSNHRAFEMAFRARGVSEADIVAAYVGTEWHPEGDSRARLRIEHFRPNFRCA